MHWEDYYCWQLELDERKWCMSCRGGHCDEGEIIWLQECNDALIQRFVWDSVDIPGKTRTGKLKPYLRQDLCLEDVGPEGNYSYFDVTNERWRYLILRTCDPGNNTTQILEGYDEDNEFELLSIIVNDSQGKPERCLSNPHDPRAGEMVMGEYCSKCQYGTNDSGERL